MGCGIFFGVSRLNPYIHGETLWRVQPNLLFRFIVPLLVAALLTGIAYMLVRSHRFLHRAASSIA